MERLTYVTENGEVLFHPEDLPDDEGMTITQLAEDTRFDALEEIAERLASGEQAEELREKQVNGLFSTFSTICIGVLLKMKPTLIFEKECVGFGETRCKECILRNIQKLN